jgi:tetratricopeptide (TPR) repeat protein
MLWACGVDSAERNNTGNTRYEESDYFGALDAYQAAQVADPDRGEFYVNAASAYLALEDTENAIAALEQAIAVGDDSIAAHAYYSLGNIHFEDEAYADAIAAYRETLLRQPDDEDARHNLELAMLYLVPPTPTAMEMKTDPEEGQTDPEATPTNNPAGVDGPTPTPPPVEEPPDPEAQPTIGGGDEGGGNNPSTPLPDIDGPSFIEDAADILDNADEDAETLRKYLHDPATPRPPLENDW